MRRGWPVLAVVLGMTGCVSHERAQNPLPGVIRIAVIPFNDKTAGDEGLDEIYVTKLFAAELQKVPSYEVVPVQEVLEVLGPNNPFPTNQPELAYAMARALHAQAIIVGDITEYKPYYPLRLGLHCEMYAMVTGEPQAVVESPRSERQPLEPDEIPAPLRPFLAPFLGKDKHKGHHCKHCGHSMKKHAHEPGEKCPQCGKDPGPLKPQPSPQQKPNGGSKPGPNPNGDPKSAPPSMGAPPEEPTSPVVRTAYQVREFTPSTAPPEGVQADAIPGRPNSARGQGAASRGDGPSEELDEIARYRAAGGDPSWGGGQAMDYSISVVDQRRPIAVVEPWVIRHSRMFDANNLGFARKIKQYYFFKRDLRGGDWDGYVNRVDDFVRFCSDRMIYEMLEAAGGRWKTLKGFVFPHPWDPWPWR